MCWDFQKKLYQRCLKNIKDSKYENLGGLKEPDFEAINALNPELIIISGRQSDMYDKFFSNSSNYTFEYRWFKIYGRLN